MKVNPSLSVEVACLPSGGWKAYLTGVSGQSAADPGDANPYRVQPLPDQPALGFVSIEEAEAHARAHLPTWEWVCAFARDAGDGFQMPWDWCDASGRDARPVWYAGRYGD